MHAWLTKLDQHFPVRYSTWLFSAVLLLLSLFTWVAFGFGGGLALLFLFLVGLGWRDTRQSRHSILRNYPVIGHLRFLLEYIRPEIRQYFIESDNEAAPFSRQQALARLPAREGRLGQAAVRHAARRVRARLRVDQPLDGAEPRSPRTTFASRSAGGLRAALSARASSTSRR